jgi:adenylate cyclase
MTAFFSDVQGFSSISENLTPYELVQLLNEYLTSMCDIITKYNGTIDKFEGDAIIAFWGAPAPQPEHAMLACFASLDMQAELVHLRKQWQKENKPILYVRIGLNSGPMIVGNMGSEQRVDYTIMGDSVNLAARLEGINKFYNSYLMISEATYNMTADHMDARELDTIRVVGKQEPVTIYEPICRKNEIKGALKQVVNLYTKGLTEYKNRNFESAAGTFEAAMAIMDDGPSATMLSRCKQYLQNPPPEDWDGVYKFTQKG